MENIIKYIASRVHPIVFPNFFKVYVYSKDERLYLESIGIKDNVNVYPVVKVKSKCKLVLVFTRASEKIFEAKEIIDLVNFFKLHHYDIRIKIHPQYDSRNLYEWSNIFGVKILSKDAGSASSLINSLSPSFIVAWESTALCESLQTGVIPIRIESEIGIGQFRPYPMKERVLSWNDEKPIIEKTIISNKFYDEVIHMLNHR